MTALESIIIFNIWFSKLPSSQWVWILNFKNHKFISYLVLPSLNEVFPYWLLTHSFCSSVGYPTITCILKNIVGSNNLETSFSHLQHAEPFTLQIYNSIQNSFYSRRYFIALTLQEWMHKAAEGLWIKKKLINTVCDTGLFTGGILPMCN